MMPGAQHLHFPTQTRNPHLENMSADDHRAWNPHESEEGKQMIGQIVFHQGDESGFKAKKSSKVGVSRGTQEYDSQSQRSILPEHPGHCALQPALSLTSL